MLALVHVSAQCCLLKVFLFLTFHTELKQSIHIVHLQTITPEDSGVIRFLDHLIGIHCSTSLSWPGYRQKRFLISMRLTWTNKGLNTLHCELYDSSVFTKGVDGMAGEEARVLPHCGHDLMGADQ